MKKKNTKKPLQKIYNQPLEEQNKHCIAQNNKKEIYLDQKKAD